MGTVCCSLLLKESALLLELFFSKASTFFKLTVFALYPCSSVLTAVAGNLEDSNKKQMKKKIFGRAKTKKESI